MRKLKRKRRPMPRSKPSPSSGLSPKYQKHLIRRLKHCARRMETGRLHRVLAAIAECPALKNFTHGDNHLLALTWSHRTGLPFFEELLKTGVHPDLRDSAGFTTLIDASAAGNLLKVNLLLKYGADVNATAYSDETAFSYACTENHLEVAQALHAHGADINKPIGQSSPLDWAERFASAEFIAWLRGVGGTSLLPPGHRIC